MYIPTSYMPYFFIYDECRVSYFPYFNMEKHSIELLSFTYVLIWKKEVGTAILWCIFLTIFQQMVFWLCLFFVTNCTFPDLICDAHIIVICGIVRHIMLHYNTQLELVMTTNNVKKIESWIQMFLNFHFRNLTMVWWLKGAEDKWQ